jgi:hypothetical protein
MKWRLVFTAFAFSGVIGCTQAAGIVPTRAGNTGELQVETVHEPQVEAARVSCPARPLIELNQCADGSCVDFKQSANAVTNVQVLKDFKDAVEKENKTVRLGPNVGLDFSGLPGDFFPISFGRCTTLMSVSAFKPEPVVGLARAGPVTVRPETTVAGDGENKLHGLAAQLAPTESSARTPGSPGPLLQFGTNHPVEAGKDPPTTFLEVKCQAGDLRDGVRLSGVRVFGPSFGGQTAGEIGVRIIDCGIEISNMEIAGWGGAAIKVESPELRLVFPTMVKIVGNFLHHNQHPSSGGHAAGYGVTVSSHASALIAENVFDFNRHAIAASGNSIGYEATRNLVLKGGGYHGGTLNRWTHQFDVHGNAHSALPEVGCWFLQQRPNPLCLWCEFCEHPTTYDRGDAGHSFMFVANAFQYRNDNAIKIRGRPRRGAAFERNVFPHDGLENDWGDDAIALQTDENVHLRPGNTIRTDTYGNYGVCDFDGDGVDDLFLATGQTWWYSSFGEFQWSYLNTRTERLNDLRLGYFDDDRRCDVLTASGSEWIISSGGYGSPRSLGAFGARLSEVEFGRFDPAARDYRRGVTRQTTHAFRRMADGQWQVTPLSTPAGWRQAQSSQLPMNELRFGDFTGDGITDVLALVNGHWSISESGHNPWRPLNLLLRDDVRNLRIANMDGDDNIDDILRLERQRKTTTLDDGSTFEQTTLIWWRSKNGNEPWEEYKRFEFSFPVSPGWTISPRFGFAGRFGIAGGGGVMVIDQDRRGRFYNHTESAPEWMSLFAY